MQPLIDTVPPMPLPNFEHTQRILMLKLKLSPDNALLNIGRLERAGNF